MKEADDLSVGLNAAAYLDVYGQAVSTYLDGLFDAGRHPATLFEAMRYSVLAGGKRLRPILCLATGQAFGIPETALLPVAASVELLHTYSLIHDDLPCMDDDDLRRGQPTNHRVFGEAAALLAGDALLTYAFEQLSAPLPIPADRQLRMTRVLANAAGCYGMVAGQMADIEAEQSQGSMSDLQFIHIHKTARLIEASVQLGALYAGVSAAVFENLTAFARSIGLTFQMVDDVLDVTATTEALGKQAGSDERLQKLTYPKLVGLDDTRALIQTELRTALSHLDAAQLDAPLLRSLARYIVDRGH